MCRRNYLRGCCLVMFGIGVMVGYSLESGLICYCGGIALLAVGLAVMRRK